MSNRETVAIQSAVLHDTLTLLAEAGAYLKRHSPVPMTVDLVRRIDQHLASPETKASHRVALENASEIELRQQPRLGKSYNVVGLPIVEVIVQGETVKVQVGKAFADHGELTGKQAVQADELFHLLKNGIAIDVSPGGGIGALELP